MDVYTRLTAKLTNPNVSVEDKLKEVCQAAASQISGAHRVSLWVFNKEFDSIKPLICYDAIEHVYIDAQPLTKSDYDAYFKGILTNEVICAPDARKHELTQCFTESYFEPLNIYSLLDFILHRDFEPLGILCCESVGTVTHWTEENIDLLRRIARASSMYFRYDE